MGSGILAGLNNALSGTFGLQVSRSATIERIKSDLARARMMEAHYRLLSQGAARRADDLEERAMALGRLLKPWRAVGHRKIRVGGESDGGYVMLDDFAGLGTAFSLGVGPNVDWDYEMAERGLTMHLFDHTVTGPPRQHGNFRFHRRRIGAAAGPDSDNLASLLSAYGAAGQGSNILKIDIENDEWPLLASAQPEDLARFPQILCEFHSLTDVGRDDHYAMMHAALQNVLALFEVVHVHGNNCGGLALVGGMALPNVLEVTFARRSTYLFEATRETFPTSVDRPNDPRNPDYYLGAFDFDQGL